MLLRAVGARGFEPPTARPPAGCATRLRHAPKGLSIPREPRRPCGRQRGVNDAMALPRLLAAPAATYDGRMRLQDASDEWLAKRAARGDADAFEQLVLRYQDRLYTLALRVTLSEPDARDCVQEGLISAWRAIDRFRGDARFSTWIYRIVLRKAYDVLDRRKRTAEPMEEIVIASSDRPADDRLDLIAALATLEPEFRAAVVACDVIGMSMDEAAAALEVPAGTVKSRLHRGRSRLAAELEAHRAS